MNRNTDDAESFVGTCKFCHCDLEDMDDDDEVCRDCVGLLDADEPDDDDE